jgi:hypothetical protein
MKQPLFDLNCVECHKFFRNPNENERLCPDCKKAKDNKKKLKQEVKPKTSKNIYQTIREIEKYNKEHKTRLSYGQYVSSVDK